MRANECVEGIAGVGRGGGTRGPTSRAIEDNPLAENLRAPENNMNGPSAVAGLAGRRDLGMLPHGVLRGVFGRHDRGGSPPWPTLGARVNPVLMRPRALGVFIRMCRTSICIMAPERRRSISVLCVKISHTRERRSR